VSSVRKKAWVACCCNIFREWRRRARRRELKKRRTRITTWSQPSDLVYVADSNWVRGLRNVKMSDETSREDGIAGPRERSRQKLWRPEFFRLSAPHLSSAGSTAHRVRPKRRNCTQCLRISCALLWAWYPSRSDKPGT